MNSVFDYLYRLVTRLFIGKCVLLTFLWNPLFVPRVKVIRSTFQVGKTRHEFRLHFGSLLVGTHYRIQDLNLGLPTGKCVTTDPLNRRLGQRKLPSSDFVHNGRGARDSFEEKRQSTKSLKLLASNWELFTGIETRNGQRGTCSILQRRSNLVGGTPWEFTEHLSYLLLRSPLVVVEEEIWTNLLL